MLIAELKMSRDYDPASKITKFGADISHHFVTPWWGYFYLPAYHWLSPTSANLDIQLDFVITAVLAAGLITVTLRWLRRSAATRAPVPAIDRPLVAVLVLSLVAYLFLQFRVSLPVYDLLAPFQVITFPFRMITFITPLALLLAALVADWYFHLARQRWTARLRWVPVCVAAAWLALLVLLSPVFAHEPPQTFLPVKELTEPSNVSFQENPPVGFADYGPMFIEYLPKLSGPNGQELSEDSSIYRKLDADRGDGTRPCLRSR